MEESHIARVDNIVALLERIEAMDLPTATKPAVEEEA